MLNLIEESLEKGDSFSFETTLSGLKWKKLIIKAQEMGYKVKIFYVYVDELDLSYERVKYRVKMGGHDIPRETIHRRFERSYNNFWNFYKNIVDEWYLMNNSENEPQVIAYGDKFDYIIENEEFLNNFIKKVKSKD